MNLIQPNWTILNDNDNVDWTQRIVIEIFDINDQSAMIGLGYFLTKKGLNKCQKIMKFVGTERWLYTWKQEKWEV